MNQSASARSISFGSFSAKPSRRFLFGDSLGMICVLDRLAAVCDDGAGLAISSADGGCDGGGGLLWEGWPGRRGHQPFRLANNPDLDVPVQVSELVELAFDSGWALL